MQRDTPGYVVDIATRLRNSQTRTEEVLWEFLRKKKLEGYKIRRQHPIGRYVADFYCAKAKLVIEIDGKIHERTDIQEYDKIRQTEIENRGIKVLRIKNEEVLNNLEIVLESIEKALKPAPEIPWQK
jgi:very-short-patch-repair endonuclease